MINLERVASLARGKDKKKEASLPVQERIHKICIQKSSKICKAQLYQWMTINCKHFYDSISLVTSCVVFQYFFFIKLMAILKISGRFCHTYFFFFTQILCWIYTKIVLSPSYKEILCKQFHRKTRSRFVAFFFLLVFI
jgi:hypothetical protein